MMELAELKSRLEALKAETIPSVSKLEEVKNAAIELAEDAIIAYEESLKPAPDYAFFGDEGCK